MRSKPMLVAWCALSAAACAPSSSAPAAEPPTVHVSLAGEVDAWTVETRGLPAVVATTGAIVVADRPEDPLVRSPLVLRWLDGAGPSREHVVLTVAEGAPILYDLEGAAATEATRALAGKVAARAHEANVALAREPTRALEACTHEGETALFCGRAQRLACAGATIAIEDDDVAWRLSEGGGRVRAGWAVAPTTIGDGPPHRMIPCVREAFYDPPTRRLVARVETVCEGGGSDACILPASWKVLALR